MTRSEEICTAVKSEQLSVIFEIFITNMYYYNKIQNNLAIGRSKQEYTDASEP